MVSCKSDADCDDQNPCTDDVCAVGGTCRQVALVGTSCDDQNACTEGETCLEGGECGGGFTRLALKAAGEDQDFVAVGAGLCGGGIDGQAEVFVKRRGKGREVRVAEGEFAAVEVHEKRVIRIRKRDDSGAEETIVETGD